MKNQNHYLAFIVLSLVSLAVSGCGIKPGKLESPSEDGRSQYPSTYPQAAEHSNQ